MSRVGVQCAAESTMAAAEHWRAELCRVWWLSCRERDRRLTGAWLAWSGAARARDHLEAHTMATRACAWQLGYTERVLRSLEADPGERLEIAMALVLWVAQIDLTQPRASAAYATWVVPALHCWPIPVPYRPQPEQPISWHKAAVYRLQWRVWCRSA